MFPRRKKTRTYIVTGQSRNLAIFFPIHVVVYKTGPYPGSRCTRNRGVRSFYFIAENSARCTIARAKHNYEMLQCVSMFSPILISTPPLNQFVILRTLRAASVRTCIAISAILLESWRGDEKYFTLNAAETWSLFDESFLKQFPRGLVPDTYTIERNAPGRSCRQWSRAVFAATSDTSFVCFRPWCGFAENENGAPGRSKTRIGFPGSFFTRTSTGK